MPDLIKTKVSPNLPKTLTPWGSFPKSQAARGRCSITLLLLPSPWATSAAVPRMQSDTAEPFEGWCREERRVLCSSAIQLSPSTISWEYWAQICSLSRMRVHELADHPYLKGEASATHHTRSERRTLCSRCGVQRKLGAHLTNTVLPELKQHRGSQSRAWR